MKLAALAILALALPVSAFAQAGTGWRITIGGQNVFVGSVARPNAATGTALGSTGFRWDFFGRNLDISGSVLAKTAADCTAGGISYSISGDTNTGIAGDGAGTLRACSDGVEVGRFGTMSGSSTDSNFFNVTGTLPTVSTIAQVGVRILVNGAGSSAFSQRAFQANFEAGYTGSSGTISARFSNDSAGTGTGGWTNASANSGTYAVSEGVGAGHNVGVAGTADSSSTLNLGVVGTALDATNTPALNVGASGLALNGTLNVGGFFGLRSTAPTIAASAALIADNGAVVADILSLRDNNSVVARVVNGGTLALIGGLIPAVSNTGANTCGTDAAVMDAGSNENAGSFVVGATAGTDCTLTFTTVAPNRWHCVSNNETTANLSRAVYIDTTHVKIQGTFVAGDRISYLCIPR